VVDSPFTIKLPESALFRGGSLTIPQGTYEYLSEENNEFYYINTSAVGESAINGKKSISGIPIIGVLREYDEIAFSLVVDSGLLRARGLGELLILMLPKYQEKRISPEGVIPNYLVQEKLSFVGSIPILDSGVSSNPEPRGQK